LHSSEYRIHLVVRGNVLFFINQCTTSRWILDERIQLTPMFPLMFHWTISPVQASTHESQL